MINLKTSRLLITLILLLVFTSFFISYLFVTDNLYYQTFGEQMTVDRITKLIGFSKKWQWIRCVFIPIVILIRISFTALCIFIGYFFANQKVRFVDLFKVALLSDFVFVLAGITKLIMLIFFKEVNTLNDLQFQPLSLLELVDKSKVDPFLIYPYSLISIFELLYWSTLAWLLSGVVKKSFSSSLKTVASTYGAGLTLWVLFVMFLTMSLN